MELEYPMATGRNSTIQGLSRVWGRGRCRGGAANVTGAVLTMEAPPP